MRAPGLRELPPGATGETVAHGSMVFRGDWDPPEAMRAAFVEIGSKPLFRSDDLARMDHEGCFFVTGRLKRMIDASSSGQVPWRVQQERERAAIQG
jgi:fatty-acyl-CoA synthase